MSNTVVATTISHTIGHRFKVWWMIFKISLEERLAYRGDFALGTLMRFLPIVTQIFLWGAIFSAGMTEEGKLFGYSYTDMVAYYLLTMLARAFSSMPGLATGIAAEIRSGEIKKYLIQPVDLLGYLFLRRIAHKVAYYAIALLPFAFVFFLCRGYFSSFPDLLTFGAFLASLVMGFLIGYYLEACIGLVGFWFLEVGSLLFIYMLLSFFLSGHMFPLDILPTSVKTVIELLPLKYLAYYPPAIFLGKIQGWALVYGLLIEAVWLLFFVVLSRVMFHFGVKRYSGFGG
ncbi:MAG: ABC-2 family transporter protein [Pirellulaceae bacterium]|nr:ABC-2 family transporter protein [Pirellulaceae bacterium]